MKKSHKAAMFLTIAASMSAGMGLHTGAPAASDDNYDNMRRSKGATAFKRKKQRHKAAEKSRRANRRKR